MVYRNRLVLDLDNEQSPELAREHNVQLRLMDYSGCCENKDKSLGQLEPITILLYEWKLLSFNPMETYQLTDAEKAEVDFLATLNKSGCSKNELKRLLKNLRRPYAYHLHSLHYNWRTNRWLYLRHEDSREILEEMLEDCINEGSGINLWLIKWEVERAEERYKERWGDLDT